MNQNHRLDKLHPISYKLREELDQITNGSIDAAWRRLGEPIPDEGPVWRRMWDDITLAVWEIIKESERDDT